jgi:hypothetical protein
LFYYLLKKLRENILTETNFEDKRFNNKFVKFMNMYLKIDSFFAIFIVIIVISNFKYEYLLIVSIYLYYLVIKNIILIIYGLLRFLNFIIKIFFHKIEEKKINPVILIFNIIITVIINIFLWGINYI